MYLAKWRYIIITFVVMTVGTWIIFGGVYRIFVMFNKECITGVHKFSEAFLFALETQTTIGFGSRHTNAGCWYGIIVVIIQTIVGILLQSCLLMIIVNKLSRPNIREKSIQFSDKVVLFKDKQKVWNLKFRIGDLDSSSYMMDVKINVQLVLPETKEHDGKQEVILTTQSLPYYLVPGADGSNIMTWPSEVLHVVNENSPLQKYVSYLNKVIVE